MCVAVLLLALALAAGPAAAHGIVPVQPDALWRAWRFDPLVVVPLLLAHWAYGRGVLRLWARAGRGRGVGVCAGSLLPSRRSRASFWRSSRRSTSSAEPSLSAHMAQHGLLVAVAPPLLLMGHPGVAFAWAFPPGERKGLFGSRVWRALARLGNALSRPWPAAALHGLALWLWHAPGAFDAALERAWVHALEHACFFGTGLLFWRALVAARAGHNVGRAIGSAFLTLVHSGLLGALITLSPHPLYGWYEGRTELWSLGALEDQQLAGLLMWVPIGAVYFATCLYLTSSLFSPQKRYDSAAS